MAAETSIRVIIVNDDEITCMLWERVINHQPGMQCVGTVYNGEDSIEMVKELKPDVVMMDVMMRGMDGFEATRQILAIRPETAVIVFTAGARLVDGAQEVGAVDWLFMPVNPDDLVESIRTAYAKKQQA